MTIDKQIQEAAYIEFQRLTKQDKKQLLLDQDYSNYHFTYGMYLRNMYIHSGFIKQALCPIAESDSLSSMLFNKIIELIKKENEDE